MAEPEAELLRSEPWTYPGAIRTDDAEVLAPETCEVVNDLAAAVEIDCGLRDGWQVRYPHSTLQVEASGDLRVSVRLRDDPKVAGSRAVGGGRWLLSQDFQPFGADAARVIREEEEAAKRESALLKQREHELAGEHQARVSDEVLGKQTLLLLLSTFILSIFLGSMVFCAVWSVEKRPDQVQAIGLAVAALLLWCFACGGGFSSFRLAHHDATLSDDDWRAASSSGCFLCCVPCVGLGCVVAMTVAFSESSAVALAVLWPPLGLFLCSCCGAVCCQCLGNETWTDRAGEIAVTLISLPALILETCFGMVGIEGSKQIRAAQGSLDAALHANQRTIAFEGSVLPGQSTVTSWPGSYESAWDGACQDQLSAAVVFLPKGSRHFGHHDAIPASPELQDLQGSCWCFPLYGEQKEWGCRWWTRWIQNVETAVQQNCTLEVYYSEGKVGRGKVKSFATAGAEHLRRAQILRKKPIFENSDLFKEAAGLEHLSQERGPDSSSPHSKEVHRLFLSWLPEEERRCLEDAEGLGQSQKAEVAWLERKKYPYVEREVSLAASPMAIGASSQGLGV